MILGIDPGLEGGWAFVTDDGALMGAGDMPVAGTGAKRMVSGPLLRGIVEPWGPAKAIVEDVHSMPKQGVASSFRFGRALGVAEGVLDGMGIPVVWVSPARWKKSLGLSADKEQSRQRAIRQWPAHAALFARKKDHGRAEAALLALWSIGASA